MIPLNFIMVSCGGSFVIIEEWVCTVYQAHTCSRALWLTIRECMLLYHTALKNIIWIIFHISLLSLHKSFTKVISSNNYKFYTVASFFSVTKMQTKLLARCSFSWILKKLIMIPNIRFTLQSNLTYFYGDVNHGWWPKIN